MVEANLAFTITFGKIEKLEKNFVQHSIRLHHLDRQTCVHGRLPVRFTSLPVDAFFRPLVARDIRCLTPVSE